MENCPDCGAVMKFEEKDTSSGTEWRTYYCESCKKMHDFNCGTALWQILHDDYQERLIQKKPKTFLGRLKEFLYK